LTSDSDFASADQASKQLSTAADLSPSADYPVNGHRGDTSSAKSSSSPGHGLPEDCATSEDVSRYHLVVQSPTWLLIVSLFLGPAVSAALVSGAMSYVLTRKLNEHKADLDMRLERYKRELDSEQQFREFVSEQRVALLEAYILVFEKGATAGPKEMADILQQASDQVMTPFRVSQPLLDKRTVERIYSVNNFLSEERIPGKELSAEALTRLRSKQGLFWTLVQDAIKDLLQAQYRARVS
jgi:hypothetical protein